MKISKNVVIVAGLTVLVVATYVGFGVANQTGIAQAQSDANQQTSKPVNLDTEKAKLGYTYGAQIGSQIASSGILDQFDIDAILMAIRDIATGKEPQMTSEEMQQTQLAFQQKQQAEFQAMADTNLAKGEAFLAENSKAENTVVTESGLQYQVVREGKGKQPTEQDTVKVHYLGALIDGTPFDSSYTRGEPADFPVSGVIPGFSEGLQLMKEGAKYRFVIPADKAYGLQGPPTIGPNQALVFEVELIEVL